MNGRERETLTRRERRKMCRRLCLKWENFFENLKIGLVMRFEKCSRKVTRVLLALVKMVANQKRHEMDGNTKIL